ncbi:PREDICTED: U11/U12 small nuclear ribonucleoprotein 48 kDa protein-like [Dinoponera quadriceps]|uniref:U11/U12 small nuclear ribonucleoprotein 48 kDa protein-like n=1 Tax=Dinoponera quadriceps TaxID=609295 RepID=A0A6P3XR35_DINQU|nr:PREDICTED: U11/U12 small nuclear ribonucleoprotein 48 kDa protein-like [Dinoponera quadriceps]
MDTLEDMTGSREEQLRELKSFTDVVNKQIADIVGSLGWTVESVTNVDKEYITCPYNPSHRLMEKSLNDHLTSCQWKTAGYRETDLPLSMQTLPVDSPFSVKFDKQLQNKILKEAKEQDPTMQIGTGERLIPHTSDRLLSDFTRDERRVLYDYVVANTAKPDIGQDITDINNLKPQEKEDKEMTFLEVLVQERNLKRRRAKHKGVHTNKKSHVEILREVINQQMEIYTEYISGQTNPQDTTDMQNIKMDDSNYETTQDRTDYLYKVFHDSPQNHGDPSSSERNGHRYSRRDDSKRERSERKDHHRSRDRDRHEKYADEYSETYRKYRHHEHKESSHWKDRKSHKKDKHRSKDRHKDKDSKKKHKSRDRERSAERHYTKHSDYKRHEKNKKY